MAFYESDERMGKYHPYDYMPSNGRPGVPPRRSDSLLTPEELRRVVTQTF